MLGLYHRSVMKNFFDTKTKRILLGIVVLFLICNGVVWHAVYTESQRKELTVAFLDIGQGDSIFIETPNGNQILIDAGPNARVLSELGKVMPWYDKTIDMIIATHPDQDHIGGFVEVLKRYKIEYELEPGVKSETQTSKVIHELIKKDSVKTYVARKGMKIELDDGVVITILYPDTDAYDMKTNDASIVARLTYGETEVMLTGDAPIKSEKEILAYKENIQSDILKVGHHGSKTSTSMEFVKAVNPTYAVISSGRGNRYGHPNQETLDVLAQFPVEVLRTDQMGAIVIKSDGRKFVLKK